MLLILDANVHVGVEGINNCKDVQDWGGKTLLSVLDKEGLTLLNNEDLCDGIVTRIDPRNGTESSIDLAICNSFLLAYVDEMKIDEDGQWKLKKYAKKVTQTDHNTVVVKLKFTKSMMVKETPGKKLNVRNSEARLKMQENIKNDWTLDNLFVNQIDPDVEFNKFLLKWDTLMKNSFQIITPKKSMKGVDADVKMLLKEEKWIRCNVLENPERGRRIAEIQKRIGEKVAFNNAVEIEAKVNSDTPQSKVFQVRRNMNRSCNIDFPLRDKNGTLQVGREGIDKIISEHFVKVFSQNSVPHGPIWEEYWKQIDETFNIISRKTMNGYEQTSEPTEAEIGKIIGELQTRKACYGPMTIDMVKLGGDKIVKLVHRCILMCYRQNILPDKLREEKMSLLYKNKGSIEILNDYRGIFLRHIILSVYQKWLYSKNAGKVDDNGSEFACGGRKERSSAEALLIVKLVQDYCRWMKQRAVIKFLDKDQFWNERKLPSVWTDRLH